MQLNLLVIKTKQIHELAEFYTDLGLDFEYHQHEQGIFHYSTEQNGMVFEIYPLPKAITEADRSTRLGFEVTDLDQLLDKLKAKGVKIVSEPAERAGQRVAVVEDLDGRKIELCEKMLENYEL